MPLADRVIVVRSGNRDGIFQELAGPRGVPVDEVESLAAAGDAAKAAYTH